MQRRRHRRRLWLPPGLLGLCFLPLGAAYQLGRALPKPQMALDLALPLKPYRARQLQQQDYPPLLYVPAHMERRRQWQTYTLIGSRGHDAATLHMAAAAVRQFEARPDRRHGVRISLGPAVRYGGLVAVLDMLQQAEAQKYLVSLYQAEPTVYVCRMQL